MLLAVIAVSGFLTPPVETQSAGDGGVWAEKARLGFERTEAAVAVVAGRVYVVGGMSRGQDSDTLTQEYDPKTDRWRERAPMPRPLMTSILTPASCSARSTPA